MLIERSRVPLLLATLALASSACAQEAGRFVGTWKAEYAGKTYVVMTIAAGTPLKLSISTAVVRVNENGEISEVEGPVEHEETVLESKIDAGVLRFKARQDDGDIVDYELRLEGDRSALLTLLEPPNVKPFRLHRS
jgi:hypothetical protein